MSRPIKEGINYFPHDTNMSEDIKIQMLESKFGLTGYAIYNKILEQVYKHGGNFNLRAETMLDFIAKKWLSDEAEPARKLDEIIGYMISISLFKNKNFLSSSIKKRLGKIEKERENKRNKYKPKEKQGIKDEFRQGKTTEKPRETPQIKGKERKGKEIKEKEISDVIPFSSFWDSYGKKVGDRAKLEKKWLKLTDADRQAIIDYIPAYIKATPEKKYRKNPETFLNNRAWLDEIVDHTPKPAAPDVREIALSKIDSYVTAMIEHPERFDKYNAFEDAASSIIRALPDVKGFDYGVLKRELETTIGNKYREKVKNAVKGIPA